MPAKAPCEGFVKIRSTPVALRLGLVFDLDLYVTSKLHPFHGTCIWSGTQEQIIGYHPNLWGLAFVVRLVNSTILRIRETLVDTRIACCRATLNTLS